MSRSGLLRALVVLAGLMGAAGVALAAAASHLPDAARLGSASSILLFHASAVLATLLLTERHMVHHVAGLVAAFGFVVATAMFAGDLTLRQFFSHGLFPMAAPLGGSLLIASWLTLAMAALWPQRT
jgi:uncharacterized membrane protein YgdD (TMEM256/DUF423 family)